MARAKKKEKEMTIEEKLERALVPVEEQPYKIPENWCWVNIESINKYNGSSVDPLKKPEDYFELYSVPSSANDYPEILLGSEIGSTKQSVEQGDVLLCKINPRINRVWKVTKYTDHELLASSEWIVVRNNAINTEYLMYCFRTQYFREYMLSNVSGVGGSLMRAQPKYVKTYPIPLAPFSEQQRIVNCIESLFDKLDEAKEKVQVVVDEFENRKATILHKAFSGELTKEWRENNGITFDSWQEIPLESVCKSIFDGDHMPPPKSETGIPFLVISNVNTGHLSYDDSRFVPKKYYDSLSETRKPELGDVLYTLVGSFGIPVVVDNERPFCFQRHMALLKPSTINTYFLWYQLQTQSFINKATRIATGTAQLTVPIKGLRKLTIVLPTDIEQIEIVNILDKLFAKEKKAKECANIVIEQVNLMKKSILACAFCGKLNTSNSNDENAIDLLKRLL